MAESRKEASFSQGWGIATLVTVMAVACFAAAFTIKSRTYVHPADPMAPSTAREEVHGPAEPGATHAPETEGAKAH